MVMVEQFFWITLTLIAQFFIVFLIHVDVQDHLAMVVVLYLRNPTLFFLVTTVSKVVEAIDVLDL